MALLYVIDAASEGDKHQPVGRLLVGTTSLNGDQELPQKVQAKLIERLKDFASGAELSDHVASIFGRHLSLKGEARRLEEMYKLQVGPLIVRGMRPGDYGYLK